VLRINYDLQSICHFNLELNNIHNLFQLHEFLINQKDKFLKLIGSLNDTQYAHILYNSFKIKQYPKFFGNIWSLSE